MRRPIGRCAAHGFMVFNTSGPESNVAMTTIVAWIYISVPLSPFCADGRPVLYQVEVYSNA